MSFLFRAARRRRRAGSAALTLSQQVEAWLSGTPGYALDPSDLTLLDQISTGGTPVVSASDPVGRYRTKPWGNAASVDFIQATAASRPAWNGAAGLSWDGVDDVMNVNPGAGKAVLNGAAAATWAVRFKRSVASAGIIGFFSYVTNATTMRLRIEITAGGGIDVTVRRNDGVAGATYSSAGGLISLNTDYTLIVVVDFTGANTIEAYLNGTQRINTALTDGTGAVSATDSNTVRLGHSSGTIVSGRQVVAAKLADASARTMLAGWLEEVPL